MGRARRAVRGQEEETGMRMKRAVGMLDPRESGADMQVVGQVFQRSATTQIAFKTTGIASVNDFKGKKIGSWGFGNEFELLAGMRKAGLDPDKDVTVVPQQFDMNAF